MCSASFFPRKEITFAYNVELVGVRVYMYILRTAYFILNLENPLDVCCYSSHLLRLANDLSILGDVSIINFVYT